MIGNVVAAVAGLWVVAAVGAGIATSTGLPPWPVIVAACVLAAACYALAGRGRQRRRQAVAGTRRVPDEMPLEATRRADGAGHEPDRRSWELGRARYEAELSRREATMRESYERRYLTRTGRVTTVLSTLDPSVQDDIARFLYDTRRPDEVGVGRYLPNASGLVREADELARRPGRPLDPETTRALHDELVVIVGLMWNDWHRQWEEREAERRHDAGQDGRPYPDDYHVDVINGNYGPSFMD